MRPAGRRVSAGGDGFGDEADAREAVPGGFAHDLRDDAVGDGLVGAQLQLGARVGGENPIAKSSFCGTNCRYPIR